MWATWVTGVVTVPQGRGVVRGAWRGEGRGVVGAWRGEGTWQWHLGRAVPRRSVEHL